MFQFITTSVEIAHRIIFIGEREGFACRIRGQQRVGAFVEVIHRVHLVDVGVQFAELAFHDVARGFAAFELLHGDAVGDAEVAHLEFALRTRVGVELKRAILAAEEPRAAFKAAHGRDRHIGRHAFAHSHEMRHHAAHLRVVDDRRRRVAGVEVIRCLLVIGDLAGDGADDGEFVGDLGEAGEIFAEDLAGVGFGHTKSAAIFGGGFGFGVPGFLLGHAAGEVEMDDAFGFAFFEETGLDGGAGFVFEKVSHAEAEGAAEADAHGFAAVEIHLAEAGAAGGGEEFHGLVRDCGERCR